MPLYIHIHNCADAFECIANTIYSDIYHALRSMLNDDDAYPLSHLLVHDDANDDIMGKIYGLLHGKMTNTKIITYGVPPGEATGNTFADILLSRPYDMTSFSNAWVDITATNTEYGMLFSSTNTDDDRFYKNLILVNNSKDTNFATVGIYEPNNIDLPGCDNKYTKLIFIKPNLRNQIPFTIEKEGIINWIFRKMGH